MDVLLTSTKLICNSQHCAEWAMKYMSYCLRNAKDGISLTLGLISVISWGVAEVPQIITNYKEKSTEGLSIAFLATWIIGDLFNVFGCMLEPATLPTQYYMAILFTLTTTILFSQTIYYDHIYPRLKGNRCLQESGEVRKSRRNRDAGAVDFSDINKSGNGFVDAGKEHILSSPIPLPSFLGKNSPGRELYYKSARSLSSSHTPTAGSFIAQKMTPTNTIEEPLLGETISRPTGPNSNTKNTLCVVSALTLIGTLNLSYSSKGLLNLPLQKKSQVFAVRVGRKLLQVSKGMQENHIGGSGTVGNLLGWGMAAIYMGGRLPQICLNIRRGHVEGLNPLMFIFALVGNSNYVASILVSSLEWSKISPNIPWLVDAGGCVLLDTFILIQFFYFRYHSPRKQQHSDI